jgi:hypothetical protein
MSCRDFEVHCISIIVWNVELLVRDLCLLCAFSSACSPALALDLALALARARARAYTYAYVCICLYVVDHVIV